MAVKIKILIRTIDNALSMLVKKGIIFREDTGLYKGNPFLFGKREWREIRELRMTFVFNREGQTISTDVHKGSLVNLEPMILATDELLIMED